MSAQMARLADHCAQDRTSVRPGERADLRYIGLESITANTGEFETGELSKTPEDPKANSFYFDSRHVLYGKLRPYLNKVVTPTFDGKCSTEIIPLLPRETLDRRYLAYFLRNPSTVAKLSDRTAGSRMPRADMDYLLGLEFPLPSLDEQRRIIDILSRAEGIVRLRREAQKKAEDIIPALFLDMFGDPAKNPKGWEISRLGEVADIQGGLQVTHAREILPIRCAYLRVANVYRGRLDLSEIKNMSVTESELRRVVLKRGDLLVVEGHGNPLEVGRVAIWDGSIDNCVHQNHIIRARPNQSFLSPTYASAFLNSMTGRQSMLRSGKTTSGLSTINTGNVKSAPIMLPPLEKQAQFEEKGRAVQSIVKQQSNALNKAEKAFQSLLSKIFVRDAPEQMISCSEETST